MTPTDVPPASGAGQTLLILGATGDLTARLLLPGLGGLLAGGAAPDLALLGSGTHEWDDEQWRKTVAGAFATVDGPAVHQVARNARYLRADVTRQEDLRRLLEACRGTAVIYFALPPAITMKACAALAGIGVPPGTRLVLEKPFGTDAASARELNQLLARLAPEDHIHRVDHFLGMSTVLNILGLRFANRIFEPLLNATHVASVDIVFDETLALEDRAGYYDGAGALADMLQSHLLQVLALLTMDAPPSLDPLEFRDRKTQVLRATRLWHDDPAQSSRRARYAAGTIDGREIPAYAQERGVDPERGTETLAEVALAVDNWRWAGVPFRLRSGKALGAGRQEAVVTFRQPPRVPDGLRGHERPNRLRIGFGPDRVGLDVNINGPDDPFVLDPVTLEASFGQGLLPPYGEVLRAALDGDATLSVRGDTAEQCWRIVAPVVAAWRAGEVPLQEYPAGSDGPGDSLLAPPAAD
ncbi:glucose-6-phosphate dehydrogenase [Actinoplanes sp. RD1]|uniref:glucose-6-phosphate dehydrogenase n=1 Tax=Actinoplanes sp. RD1 TaxID=3064538 RepID=UPI002740430D|nr:glucose-6-phosphate dehydrogenase [Actinoplanes sp. RD1]